MKSIIPGLSWIKKTPELPRTLILISTLFYAFNYPGLQPGVIANPELTGALAQKPAKV
jgi:hypothetical protein